MMWTQWQVYEKFDWDERDQSFRKQKKIGEPVWFSVNEITIYPTSHMPPRTEEMIAKNQYWFCTYETLYQKERPVS